MATPEEQITPADAAIVTTGTGRKGPEEHDLPQNLKYDMDLCLKILRDVLGEYNPDLLSTFDTVRNYAVEASAGHFSEVKNPNPSRDGLKEAVDVIDDMTLHDAQLLARAFATYFHLANLSEENYRVSVLHERENNVSDDQAVDPINELTVAYHQLINEMGPAKAKELLDRLEFHPVFTAHPTEARRKAVEGKIRRISELLEEYKSLGGLDKKESLRRLYNEIDALFRTSPIALKKPTPVEEADTILDIFDNTLFNTIPAVYRRFDDWVLGDKAGLVEPACPAFFRPGSWIGSDRDGNPNVTAKVSRQVARKFSDHVIAALEEVTRTVGRNLTMEAETTPPSADLKSLWSHQKEMSERLTDKAALISNKELHRAVMLVMADRLHYTIERDADLMYHSCDDFIADLKVVQQSLAAAGAKRSAYGPLQDLIWQAQTFGFHMVEMEFRQHSVVHARALADIREHGLHGERGDLQPMTHEVLDTFRALGAIQKRNGLKAARRYIISFTKSAQNIKDVYELNR
ncbi:MAG: phosphoenolpyruvate carboxylase, partial [Bifidobacterium breve]|nr:phosphoenolpyruvate carboxylase [Bifidobacterium breve]